MRQSKFAGKAHVLAAAAAGFERCLRTAGADPDRVLGEVGLTSTDIEVPTTAVPLATYCKMLQTAATHTRNPNFGLSYGSQFGPEDWGLLGFAAIASPTAGAALHNFIDLFPHHQNGTEARLHEATDIVRLEYQILEDTGADRRQDAEFTIAAFASLARFCLGSNFCPVHIGFEHANIGTFGTHHATFDADVSFCQPTNYLVLQAVGLDKPMPRRDVALLDLIRSSLVRLGCQQIEVDLVARVRKEVRAKLPSATATIHNVANSLKISSWTLQRRLSESGLSFSDVVDGVRRDLAASHISQRHVPLSEIAFLLGYSELSAFSRAYGHWHGCSPSTHRRQLHKM